MGLSNVLTSVYGDLQTQLAGYAPLAGVVFKSGARELKANDDAPRIVWVRQPGTFDPGEQGHQRAIRTTSRILRTHLANVEAHVWALPNPANNDDDSDCELLAHTLVGSIYRMTHGSFALHGDEWPQPEWLTRGYLCVLHLHFRIPVLDVVPTFRAGPNEFPFDQSTAPPPSGELQAPGDD